MRKHSTCLVASLCATLIALLMPTAAYSANTAPATEQLNAQTQAVPDMEQAIAQSTGYSTKMVDIATSPHKITLSVINSPLNTAPKARQEAEASAMVSTLANAMSGKTSFAQVIMIHVNYVKRLGKKNKIIQQFDFAKSPAGIFVLHKS